MFCVGCQKQEVESIKLLFVNTIVKACQTFDDIQFIKFSDIRSRAGGDGLCHAAFFGG